MICGRWLFYNFMKIFRNLTENGIGSGSMNKEPSYPNTTFSRIGLIKFIV